MFRTKLAVIYGLSTALVLTGTVTAHEEDYSDLRFDRVGYFADVDANQDGKVSREEYLEFNKDSRRYDREWREEHWDEMIENFDSDNDEHITTAEVGEFVEQRLAEVHERLKNIEWFGDHDFEFEFDAGDYVFDFEGHDFHHRFDGEEFSERLAEKMERVEKHIERTVRRIEDIEIHIPDGDELEFAFRAAPRFELRRHHRMMIPRMDENEDGVISREEFVTEREELFKRLDKNEDGVLDEEELDRGPFRGFAFHWADEDEDEEEDE